MVYSLESVIAEKLHAIVKFFTMTSRMKDYYDIVFLAQYHPFNLVTLSEAINWTFRKRETTMTTDDSFWRKLKEDTLKQRQWESFLARHQLDFYHQFSEVVIRLETFIVPVYKAELTAGKSFRWNPEKWEWES